MASHVQRVLRGWKGPDLSARGRAILESHPPQFSLIPIATALVAATVTVIGSMVPAIAAETVVLHYGALQGKLPVADLRDLVDRKAISPAVQAGLTLADQDADTLRQVLGREVSINKNLLDRALASPLGDAALEELSQIIIAPKDRNSRRLLREALVAAADNDNRLSIVEILERYPSNDVGIRVDRLAKVYEQLSDLEENFNDVDERLNDLLDDALRWFEGLVTLRP